MSQTTRVLCACQHEYQDKLYGKGVRVANATIKRNEKQADVRCTVCSKVHQVPVSSLKGN